MFEIERFKIGDERNKRCFIIGEIAQAHDGSLGMAHAYIDAIALAGADAVKFQTHFASVESTLAEPWRVKFSKQDLTRYDYWKRMEFTPEQWAGLKEHAEEKGLVFISSPFSIKAVNLLDSLGMSVWKIASGEINNYPLIDAIIKTKKPIILSTGMSPVEEIVKTVDRIQSANIPLAILQCTSNYPTKAEDIGLNIMTIFRKQFNTPVGLSDHSGKIYPGLALAALGGDILEIHVTMSKEMFGPDVIASVTTAEFKQMIEGMRFTEKMVQCDVNKDALSVKLEGLRKIFIKSIHAARPIVRGQKITEEDLIMLKPGTGLDASKLEIILNSVAEKDINKGEMISESFFKKLS